MSREVQHYRIEEPIGKGGMGEVFRAKDLRLGRTVALKFLPEAFARDSDHRARFLLEAQATSRLSSPHIATLFDIGEEDGVVFLVMEYVEGVPLSARLSPEGLPVSEAVDIASQAAEALGVAHWRGVIHRDIKPSNIMLDDAGQVKVLDFGLAKLFTLENAALPTVVVPPLTVPGSVMGTFDYMSPEQALGEEVDHRTDIFSLGIVLYEMLCGVRPFRADNARKVLDLIVHAPTPPLQGRASQAPASIARIVSRCLEKDPDLRYQTAAELIADLLRWNVPVTAENNPATSEHSSTMEPPMVSNAVAVTTFANVTQRPEDDWLGVGIAETVTTDLRRTKGLAVVDRERVCSLDAQLTRKGRDSTDSGFAISAGRAVGAAWVVVGGFQRLGDAIRITARITDTATGTVMRTIKIDGPMSSIFVLQDRIVDELCDGLDFDLARSEMAAIERKETRSIDAFRAYSRGIAELRSAESEGLEQAISHLSEAVELDPSYAVAWAALGSAYCLKGLFYAQRDLVREAIIFASKALELDPKNALAHEWLSTAYLTLGQVDEAVASSREAMRIDPLLASARAAHGRAYWMGRGMIDEGIRELERSTVLDPNLGYAYLQLGFLYAITGDFERGEAVCRRAVELEDRNVSGTRGLKIVGARTRLGYVLYRLGRYSEALEEYLTERRIIEEGGHALRERALIELDQKIGAVYLKLGESGDAAVHLSRAIATTRARAVLRQPDPSSSYYVACAHALLGQTSDALDSLAAAMTQHPTVTAIRALRDPDLESLVNEPEFKRLVTPTNDDSVDANTVSP